MQELTALQDGDISEFCYGHQMDLFKRKLKELKLENHKEWDAYRSNLDSVTHTNPERQMETHLHLNTKGPKSLSSLVLGDFLLQLRSRSVWIHTERFLKFHIRNTLRNMLFNFSLFSIHAIELR